MKSWIFSMKIWIVMTLAMISNDDDDDADVDVDDKQIERSVSYFLFSA